MTQLLVRPDGTEDGKPKPPPSDEEQADALKRLILVLVSGVIIAIGTGTWKTVTVSVAVMAMIMLHEFGHFTMAKRAGMKVSEFFLGFGPRLWSVRKGETEYGVKAIVLAGGYVRIVGMSNLEEVDPADEPRTYRAGSFPRRLSVVAAGSVMHFIIAFVLLFVLHSVVGVLHVERSGAIVRELARSDAKTPSPAEKAGVRVGDVVTHVDGQEVTEKQLTAYIRTHLNEPIELSVVRDDKPVTLTLVPADGNTLLVKGKPLTKDHVGFAGVAVQRPTRAETANPIAAVGRAGGDVGRITALSARGLVDLFSFNGIRNYGDQLTGKVTQDDPEGQNRLLSPVGLVRIASAAADSGIRDVLYLLVMINIFVGMFNMLPLLPFDGGHVAIAVYEAIRSKFARRKSHADVAKLLPVTYLVFLGLMFLAVTSLYLDIAKPLNLQ
jgi:membrane-associated protease RseP (regulator of RpoE activity)